MILTIIISVILSTIINAYLNYKLVYIYINKIERIMFEQLCKMEGELIEGIRKIKDNEVKP